MLTIAALSTPDTISAPALAACKAARALFVQTAESPAMLPIRDLPHTAMDDLYESAGDFDELNAAIAGRLLAALKEGDAVYAVPGAGASEGLLALLQGKTELRLLPGAGYAAAARASLGLAPAAAGVTAMANGLPGELDPYLPLAVEEIDSALTAGEVKLHVSEYWPDDWPVCFGCMDERGTYHMEEIPLYELDRRPRYGPDAVLLVPPADFESLRRHGYGGLAYVVHRLRAPGGCPWDREQTHESIKKNLLEECYEVLDAIDRQDVDAICEELGDVLLQVALHTEMAAEQGAFTGRDVTTGIVDKLVYRHPHVFAGGQAKTSKDVLVKWEQLKKKEKHFSTQAEVLAAVPRCLPALVRAAKVQKKAADVGFDWNSAQDALPKLREEVEEFRDAFSEGGERAAEEMGDLLFAAVNVARLAGLDAESLLAAAADKFTRRFAAMERMALENGNSLEKMALDEQNALWDRVKSAEYREKI